MGCTTILIGKNASYDGSTLMARADDAEDGHFDPVAIEVLEPSKLPKVYKSVISHCEVKLPSKGIRCTYSPRAEKRSEGIWGEAGINDAGVAMTATETITTNAAVLGADPLVEYVPAHGSVKAVPGGIGEEDYVNLLLPYIKSAREGVQRMGKLLEQYGTYESNGVGFADEDEIWWIETLGGHHWIARRLPDDTYALIANQLSLDYFDLKDAYGAEKNFMCSADLVDWMKKNHLVPAIGAEDAKGDVAPSVKMKAGGRGKAAKKPAMFKGIPAVFNPRKTFGSNTWRDRVYNTPRVWYGMSILNPSSDYFSAEPEFSAQSPDLPWCRVPEARITVEDVRTVMSSHYQNTEYDPYGSQGSNETRRLFRPIGINRTSFCALLQVRPNVPRATRGIMWIAMSSMPFSTFIPLFTSVSKLPLYMKTPLDIDTHTFYWQVRMIAGLADPEFYKNVDDINTFSESMIATGLNHIAKIDDSKSVSEKTLEEVNTALCKIANGGMQKLLGGALYNRSMLMLNRFDMSDH